MKTKKFLVIGLPRDDVHALVPGAFSSEADLMYRYFVGAMPDWKLAKGAGVVPVEYWSFFDECNTKEEAEALARFWNRLERERS